MITLLKSLFGASMAECAPAEARLLLDAGAIVIDVREPGEYAGGSLPGAINVPLSQLNARGPAALAGVTLPEQAPILLLCRSGMRSRSAGAILAGIYGERLRNVSGGILAWQSAGLPLERDR